MKWIHTVTVECGDGITYTEDHMSVMEGLLILGSVSYNGTTYLVIV